MAVTLNAIRKCYELALEMRSSPLGISEAKRRVEAETGMGAGSAQDYLYNVVRLLDGRSYTRTMNPEGTAAILTWIDEDFGRDVVRTAATAVLQHVEYYRQLETGGPQHKVREAALDKLSIKDIKTQVQSNDSFQARVRKSMADSRANRLERLASSDGRPATTVEFIPRFVRNPDVVAEALHRAAGNCEGCQEPAPFTTRKGRPYLEVHHRIPLAEGGDDKIENAMALCPNCHREAHYGQKWKNFRE